MVEFSTALILLGVALGFGGFILGNGVHLRPKQRILWRLRHLDEFEFSQKNLVLHRISDERFGYRGFALDDSNGKLVFINGDRLEVFEYTQVLEWRVLVNRKPVASLSRLASPVLVVQEPDLSMKPEQFLEQFALERTGIKHESIVIKFSVRNYELPAFEVSMMDLDQSHNGLESLLERSFRWIDKFKIIMSPT